MPMFETRDYQTRITEKAISHFSNGGSSVSIESPVGSGKTFMGLRICNHFAQQGLTIGWMAHRRNLLSQVLRERDKFGFAFDIQPISMFGSNPPHVDLLVHDEQHRGGVMTANDALAAVRPKLVLGLSATPQRTDKVDLCFQLTIKDCGINELIQQGHLSRYNHYVIPSWDPATVAEHYVKDPDKWGKSLVFWHTYEECALFQNYLRQFGITESEIVTANTDRTRQIQDFENGKLKVLINMLLLTEGMNVPSIKTVWVRDSAKNPTIQMAGRVFRKFDGVQFKQVVQSENTHYPITKTADAETQYKWQGGWKSVTTNKMLDAIADRTRRIMVQAAKDFCQSELKNKINRATTA